MLYILAGTYEQAAAWAHKRAIVPSQWVYVRDAQTLVGCWGQIAFVGSWRQRNGLRDAMDLIYHGLETERLTEFTGTLPYTPRLMPNIPDTAPPPNLFRDWWKIWALAFIAGVVAGAVRWLSR